jgi:hypothetical protein
MSYFRIKEITSPATVLRQGNLLNIHLGDFIYPDEVATIVCDKVIVYWDDRTGEHFTWAPGDTTAPVVETPVEAPTGVTVETSTEVAPAPLEAEGEDTKA